ncbi:MAG: DoxX family protein, partial [Gemmatimonadota bacterium]
RIAARRAGNAHEDRWQVKRIWAGRILSGIAVLFLAMDFTIKLMLIQPVVDSFARLGIPAQLPVTIGVLELICVAVYLIPATSILGAILLTGYLGGAMMCHVRVGDPLVSHILFPGYVGIMLWGGLWLREPRLKALIPLRPTSGA